MRLTALSSPNRLGRSESRIGVPGCSGGSAFGVANALGTCSATVPVASGVAVVVPSAKVIVARNVIGTRTLACCSTSTVVEVVYLVRCAVERAVAGTVGMVAPAPAIMPGSTVTVAFGSRVSPRVCFSEYLASPSAFVVAFAPFSLNFCTCTASQSSVAVTVSSAGRPPIVTAYGCPAPRNWLTLCLLSSPSLARSAAAIAGATARSRSAMGAPSVGCNCRARPRVRDSFRYAGSACTTARGDGAATSPSVLIASPMLSGSGSADIRSSTSNSSSGGGPESVLGLAGTSSTTPSSVAASSVSRRLSSGVRSSSAASPNCSTAWPCASTAAATLPSASARASAASSSCTGRSSAACRRSASSSGSTLCQVNRS